MRGLKGKNVLVTGGASGIGQATAARFLEEGCAVCVLDRDSDARTRVAEELPDLAAVIDADVSAREQVRRALQEAIDCMGSVDVLINNAGISIRHDFLKITNEEWNTVLGVNLTGVFNVAQEAARHMVDKGSGVILNTASTAGNTGYPHYADYSASKGGVHSAHPGDGAGARSDRPRKRSFPRLRADADATRRIHRRNAGRGQPQDPDGTTCET